MKYAKVAVESAVFTFDKAFDYAIPAELEQKVKKGCRVTVPFGNGNKKRLGIVFDLSDVTESKRIKKITEVLDEEPLLNDEMLSLAEWIKDRTFCTLYEAAKAMLPTGINHRMVLSYAVNPDADSSKIDALEGNEKEREYAEILRAEKLLEILSLPVFKRLKGKTLYKERKL